MSAAPKGFAKVADIAGNVGVQKRVNGWFGSRTYSHGGCAPTGFDNTVFLAVPVAVGNDTSLPHLYRWYQHMLSLFSTLRALLVCLDNLEQSMGVQIRAEVIRNL